MAVIGAGRTARESRAAAAKMIPAAEVQRQRLVVCVDVVEVEAGLQLMVAAKQAERVEHLVAVVLPRLRREALAADAGDAEDLERRSALIVRRRTARRSRDRASRPV